MTPMEQSERKGLVERIRLIAEAVYRREPSGERTTDYNVLNEAADLLSSDARPAPMAEEVKDKKPERDDQVPGSQEPGGGEGQAPNRREPLASRSGTVPTPEAVQEALAGVRGAETVCTGASTDTDLLNDHIDDLTRKVAEAEADRASISRKWYIAARDLVDLRLSSPQETDAVLAEREACAKIADAEAKKWDSERMRRIAAAIRSRPSPGPATETERKDGGAAYIALLLEDARRYVGDDPTKVLGGQLVAKLAALLAAEAV